MTAATDAWENGIAQLYFLATPFANVADNAASSPMTEIQGSLHTASPDDDGDQTTNEIGYTSYTRAGTARSDSGFDVVGGSITMDSPLAFPAGTGGSGTASHFGLGRDASSTGQLHFYGALTPNIVCGDGVTPQIDVTVTFD